MIAMSAGQEAEFGNIADARRRFASAAPSSSHDGMITAAVALAAMGDVAPADKLVDQLNRQFPSDTIIQTYWLPTLRAMLALDRKDPQQALAALGTALPYELGTRATGRCVPRTSVGRHTCRRGKDSRRRLSSASSSRQRGIVKNSPLGALAQLQLARSQALAGDVGGARVRYQDFFGLWQNADPNVPVFQQAKAEYAKLQ